MENDNEMIKEEIEKKLAEHKADWDAFIKDLTDNPDGTVKKSELLKLAAAMMENLNGMAQLTQMIMHNQDALNHNFNQIAAILQGGKQKFGANKTPGGIIIP
jgi:hypothetical protein